MSIKIHDGLIAAAADPFAAAQAIRAVLEPEFLRRFYTLLGTAKEAILTDPSVTWDELVGRPGSKGKLLAFESRALDHTLHEIVGELHREREFTFSPAAIAYDVSLMANAAGGSPLVLLHAEEARAYRELLLASGVVRAYGYWDNSDPDEDATQEEWAERERAWALLSDKSPSEVGLSFTYPGYIQTAMARQSVFD